MNTVEHKGIVKKVQGRDIAVEICRSSACGACEANGFCGVEREQQLIVIKDVDQKVRVGDEVIVAMKKSLGMQAVLLAYVFPMIIFFFLVVFLSKMLHHEWLAGLLSLLFLSFYYIIIWCFRVRLSKSFVFHLKSN